ncbi:MULTISPECIES: hypothetical protein [Deinococcus]|uniref:DUF1376 domain-containing protein n=1 Tax=Deinococcus rufus TaxID=2136097 RepID=A0ABV7Z6K5_9DEIO|nr:hypothetical protein [Deinococcus sp. AB2017081]WQE94411.1 hypothetical protein U2P90_13480 [Deinococcus sp. AB2017081]
MTTFFTKDFSNFFRIPESALLRSNAAWDIYLFLQDMVYRKDASFYGRNAGDLEIASHKWREGKVGTLTTLHEIESYRGWSRNTIIEGLKCLIRLGFVKLEEGENPERPFDPNGLFYIVGRRLKNKNGNLTAESVTFYEDIENLLGDSRERALEWQAKLIKEFKSKKPPMPIHNLRFEGVSAKAIKKLPRKKSTKPEMTLEVMAVEHIRRENGHFTKGQLASALDTIQEEEGTDFIGRLSNALGEHGVLPNAQNYGKNAQGYLLAHVYKEAAD